MKISSISKLIILLAIPQIVGVASSLFTIPAINSWYATLVKSPLTPPAWVFGPVWTGLYLLMGIAAFLVSRKFEVNSRVRMALFVFCLQLVLNFAWSIIFFGGHAPVAAFVEIIVLWLTILWTIISFAKISRVAAWLLVPYIVWVTFAAYLNWSIIILNR